jgi:hypothetical protein
MIHSTMKSAFQLGSRRCVSSPAFRRSNILQSIGRRSMMAFEDHARLRVRMRLSLVFFDCSRNERRITSSEIYSSGS